MKKLVKLKRNLLLLLLPLSFGLLELTKHNSWFAEEVFAKRIYHYLSIILSNFFGIFPYSVAEFFIILAPIALTIIFIFFLLHIIRSKGRRHIVISKGIINILCGVSIGFFLYTIGCGINYYRYPFSYYSKLTILKSTEEELQELCFSLANQANELRDQIISVDEELVYKSSYDDWELSNKVKEAYNECAKEYPILSGYYARTKPVVFSRILSKMEITGIFIPFTMEANVNVDIPDYSIASTMAHEMSHVRGFMREDEANYISYLVCMASDSVEIKYSGIMQALIISGNALYARNASLYREVSAMYNDGVRRDLNANSIYWEQFENTIVSNTAEKINNAYLQANNQQDGVQSYGRMVDLLLAEYRTKKNG